MGFSLDNWMKEFNEASKLADDISGIMSEMDSMPSSCSDIQQNLPALRRKKTILVTRLDRLESMLSNLPTITNMELRRLQEMLSNLRSKAEHLESNLSISNLDKSINREDLVGQVKSSQDEVDKIVGMDNNGILHFQRQIMKEQDEGLEKLQATILSTKHLALAVNEELDLHAKLIETLDQDVDVTDSRLQQVQKRLAIINKRITGRSSYTYLLASVIAVVILTVAMWDLIKYL